MTQAPTTDQLIPITVCCPGCDAIFKTRKETVHCPNCGVNGITAKDHEFLTSGEDQLTYTGE